MGISPRHLVSRFIGISLPVAVPLIGLIDIVASGICVVIVLQWPEKMKDPLKKVLSDENPDTYYKIYRAILHACNVLNLLTALFGIIGSFTERYFLMTPWLLNYAFSTFFNLFDELIAHVLPRYHIFLIPSRFFELGFRIYVWLTIYSRILFLREKFRPF